MAKSFKVLCPNHDDHRPSLNVNAITGAAYCFVCGHRTRLDVSTGCLAPKARSAEVRPALALSELRFTRCDENTAVELWLARRYVTTEVANDLGMRAVRLRGYDYLAFHYVSLTGLSLYWKLRHVDRDNKFIVRVPRGAPSALYNLPALSSLHNSEPPILVEGEPDVAAVVQSGERGVVSVPDGCGSQLSKEVVAPLRRFSRVKIGVDHDAAGDTLAARLVEALSPALCERISWNGGLA